MNLPVQTDERQPQQHAQVPDEWFVSNQGKTQETDSVKRPSLSYAQDAWRRLKKNKLAMAGLFILLFLFVMAAIGPFLSPHSVERQSLTEQNLPPSADHWFGTDELGRDVFTRTWYGARISLFVGVMAALIDFLIGVIYGGIAGYKGGRTDSVMMRIIEVLYGLPYLLVVILLMVLMGPGLGTIIVALTVTGWVGMARIVRGQVLQIKNYEYVLASKTFGAKTFRIIRKNLLPNTMGAIIVQMTLTVPTAIFAESFLSFLGLGIQAPFASWGVMANDGLPTILSGHWWRLFFPAFFISLTMYAFNVLGDGLQDALDPKLRR
ncbi:MULTISPECIES: dipeptide ABC transporter permease DppC [Bacillus]|uniref:dipeptide ABC transporter permease DppC n=1 Tax=Bacillus TaxID=1386 RepID=UPI00039AC462|nr:MULTISPECIES: dipeptide ABC transporter permease DppC [Bacillus]KUP30946.1 diguanylate cyclase [Bacillus halotolerans]MBL4964637.1 dipeptide ABC transporter permease DppC [Bacillus halotolerans]MBL4968183.1 dipeptide ABC transporter permease DppC [Bacillus halotolerans]MBL4972244.1 dipeptide ABC transporter permease DppC [Bacillus halotolerans]MCC8352360.1 dipeptide ABC transporter permease DppC [Bacillus sp. AF23]